MIALDNVSKRYGGRFLLREVSLRLGDDERVALVGANGAGKSTLMKIIMGLVEPDAGGIVQSRSNTVGYLPQDGVSHAGRTLLEEARLAFDDLVALHDRAEEIGLEIERLASSGPGEEGRTEELALELGKIHHHLEHRQGYNINSRIEQVLAGLGFRRGDLSRLTDEFSGGWQMRLALAKLLLREPTILMLDEPTNHLDIESLEWLEEYLAGYEGSVMVISHDRRFLDNLVRRTVEVAGGKLTEYAGNFSRYLEEKARRMEILRSRYENQQDKIKAAMQFVDRFRYKATKARQVQSRLKALSKIERVAPEEQEEAVRFDFPVPPSPGRVLLKLEGIGKAYGGLTVFKDLSLTIERGDRMAFLGVNGAGKSTLARILAGCESFQGGSLTPGHNLALAYYAQHQAEELEPARTVLETLEAESAGEGATRLRTLLGCFLFSGDDVFKKVGVLSGGEKSRLALAKMLLQPANLLILDEPTNHLDVRSKAVLRDALARFQGSFVVVSHDRDFLEPLVNKVAEFRDGRVDVYPGRVSEYLERVLRRRLETAGPARGPAGAGSEAEAAAKEPPRRDKERKRREAEERHERYRKARPLETELGRLEGEIARAEGRKKEVETALADGPTCRDGQAARALACEYKEVTTHLAYLYEEWARTQEELEGLGS